MSVSTEVDRLQIAADGIRGKMMELGAAESSDNLTTLSQKITVLEKPNGNKGQIVGFVENNEIGAMDAPSGTGGGAIPAYIVGDTMTSGWLSETENGTALTPVDKQEYVIVTSGEWLRKHVMWVEEIGVYRLTGKVETTSDLQGSYVIGEHGEDNTLTGKIGAPRVNDISFYEMTVTRGMKELMISGSGRPEINNGTKGDYVYVKLGDEIVATAPIYDYLVDTWYVPFPTATIVLTPDDIGKKIEWHFSRKNTSTDVFYTINIHATINDIYDDYETDDVIDITESEIETIWGETAGAADPTNNVFSTEERLWGYWIDGKPIDRKTVDCGTLPNRTNKEVAHGISNIDDIVGASGIAIGMDNGVKYSLPLTYYYQDSHIGFYANATVIGLYSNGDRSSFTGYVTLYYTKTA